MYSLFPSLDERACCVLKSEHPMRSTINDLPDDMISHILSFLSIKDTLRARLTSPRWLNLPDFRSVVDINDESVVGESTLDRGRRRAVQPKFIEIVNHFMQLWSGNKTTTLSIVYPFDEECFGELEKWIAKAFSMKVESMEIWVRNFIFPCSLIQREHKSHLKRLCLFDSTPSFLDSGYTSWMSKLTTLRLVDVPLDSQKMGVIFTCAANLASLELINCGMDELTINSQLLHLKKLEIIGGLMEVRLSCPSLEVFYYCGRLASLRFVHVPVLREVEMYVTNMDLCSSVFFNDISIEAPSLESLSIYAWNEIIPVPPHLVRFGLKKLKLHLLRGFDLLSVKYLLNACPCLEELELKLLKDDNSNPEIGVIGRLEHWDQRKHHKLRKVKMERFHEHWNAVKMAKYILRNAVALEEMEIITPSRRYVLEYYQSLRLLKDKLNPTARFIVSHIFNDVLDFRMYCSKF